MKLPMGMMTLRLRPFGLLIDSRLSLEEQMRIVVRRSSGKHSR